MNCIHRILLAASLTALSSAAVAAPTQGVRTTQNGVPLRWHTPQLDVAIDDSVLAISPDAREYTREALSAWSETEKGRLPELQFTTVSKGSIGYAGAPSCTVLYRPQGEALAGKALAITITTYDQVTGVIYDADVVINGSADHPFAQLDASGKAKSDDKTKSDDTSKGDDTSKTDDTSKNDDTSKTDDTSKGDKAKTGDTTNDSAAGDKAVTQQALTTQPANAFDLQSVLTHEGGHFFGLADMPDAPTATMYPITARGETTKRIPSVTDLDALHVLYAAGSSAPAELHTAGCGASVARAPTRAGAPITAGLLLLACAAFRARRLARSAFWSALGVALLTCTPHAPSAANAADRLARAADATARVTGVRLSREGGIFRTELALDERRCHTASCPKLPSTKTVWGGADGRVVQAIGETTAPRIGDRVGFRLASSPSWLDAFAPTLTRGY